MHDSTIPGLRNFGLINASRSVSFPENSYSAKNIDDWKNIIQNKIKDTNIELTSTIN